jgi:hypothetical protein
MNQHLSDNELIDRLYGLMSRESALYGHAESCGQCRDRLQAFESLRAASREPEAVPADVLAAQKRAILARIEEAPRAQLRWAPAVAVAVLAIAAAIAYRPGQAPGGKAAPANASVEQVTDESLLAEIYALEMAEEPRAAAPIRGLFASPEEAE